MERTALPKPPRGTARRHKAKRKRLESKQVKSVRAQCVERDGYCLIETRPTTANDVVLAKASAWWCSGPSEWAHIGKHRRCHTRGQAPEQRHTTAGSAMLCKRHHDAYDAHDFDIEPTTDKGMDGPFKVTRWKPEPLILPRNCGNCRFFDGDAFCTLPQEIKLILGYIVAPSRVVCGKHEPNEAES